MAAAEEPDPIRLDAIAIEPNPAPLTAQLDVHVDFEAQDTFPQAFWEITFTADNANRRKVVVLGSTPAQHMERGPQAMDFHIDQIDVSALKKHVLTNVGLISLKLFAYEPAQEIVHVGMVTQVTEKDGELWRHIYNPLE